MKTFIMERGSDESGVSGTGTVLEGVVFDDGKVVIRWLAGRVNAQSTALFDTFEAFQKVHVDSHPSNETIIRFGAVEWSSEVWYQSLRSGDIG